LNSKIVEHEEKLKKQELSNKNRMKMEKDKADLNKQKSVPIQLHPLSHFFFYCNSFNKEIRKKKWAVNIGFYAGKTN
jgi:hypothetical protein